VNPQDRRRRALNASLFAAGGLSLFVALFLVVQTVREGRNRWLEDGRLEGLRTELAADPADQDLMHRIRELDRQQRQAFVTYRRQRTLGARLLFLGGAWILVALRLRRSVTGDRPPRLPPLPEEQSRRWARVRTRAFRGLVALGVLLVLGFVLLTGLSPVPNLVSLRLPTGGELDLSVEGLEPVAPASVSAYGTAEWQESWPQFRGPTSMGLVPPGDWPREWDAETGKGLAWKVPLPELPGHSSPVVWGERLFLTGADAGEQAVYCFSTHDGSLVWETRVEAPRRRPQAFADLYVMPDTGYAAPTAATNGSFVYATFATADIVCLDFDGNLVWARNMGVPDSMYGLASSLAIYTDLVIWQLDQGMDGEDNLSFLYALDAATGETRYRVSRPVGASWSSPVVAEIDGEARVLTTGNPWVVCYSAGTGEEVWRADVLNGDVAPMPVLGAGSVFVTTAGAQTAAVRLGGTGDVTETHVLWTSYDGMPDTASPVTDGKVLVQTGSDGLVACSDCVSGELLWEEYFDCGFQASPCLSEQGIYLWGDDGSMFLIEPGHAFNVLSRAHLHEELRATPAYVRGRIYVRTAESVLCLTPAGEP
jgi:outer membrane protein assembly factor BamB